MKDQMTIVILLTVYVIFAVVAFGSAAPAPAPDMPLAKLLDYAPQDINKFWQQTFASSNKRYAAPLVLPYYLPYRTPCGDSLMNNAFYCPPDNIIHYDYNFISRIYSQVGDYAVASLIAHEWGHSVQTQLGISKGKFFSIQMELQADCFAGAYTQYARQAGELEDGDLEKAGVGLFNAGDRIGTPWFAPQAHGKPMERISAFLDGYKGGVKACFSR